MPDARSIWGTVHFSVTDWLTGTGTGTALMIPSLVLSFFSFFISFHPSFHPSWILFLFLFFSPLKLLFLSSSLPLSLSLSLSVHTYSIRSSVHSWNPLIPLFLPHHFPPIVTCSLLLPLSLSYSLALATVFPRFLPPKKFPPSNSASIQRTSGLSTFSSRIVLFVSLIT